VDERNAKPDVSGLTLEQVEPEMAAMVVQLEQSRPAHVDKVDWTPAALPETLSVDQAAETMHRLKRETDLAAQTFHQQPDPVISPETQRYLSLLESTVAAFQSINLLLLDKFHLVSKKMEEVGENVVAEVMNHVEVMHSESSHQHQSNIDSVKTAVLAHLAGVNPDLGFRRLGQAVAAGQDEGRGQARQLHLALDRNFQRLNQTLDDKSENLETFVDERLGQLRQWIVANPDLTLEQLQEFFNEKWEFSVIQRTLSGQNQTRDHLVSVVENRFDRVDATLADFRLRFDAQDVVLDKGFELTANQSALLNECVRQSLGKQPLFGKYWDFMKNIWEGTVPENSDLWHPQTFWDLLSSQKILLSILGVLVYLYRLFEDRASSNLAKKLGVRQHPLCKVKKRPVQCVS
jgi:hypothetical protein